MTTSDRQRSVGRVFVGLTEIAGYYGELARGLSELGVRVSFVNRHGHLLRYAPIEPDSRLVRLVVAVGRRRTGTRRSSLARRVWWKVVDDLLTVPLFVWAVLRHDVFVFGFATSFFGFRELPLLRLLGKRTICVFNGSDIRPSYIDGSEMAPGAGRSIEWCVRRTAEKRRLVARVERSASVVASLGSYSQLLQRPFVATISLGIPSPPLPAHAPPAEPLGVVVALHAPSQPEAKGSDLIRGAVRRLQAEGEAIELREIVGQPNAAVLEALVSCDFVIDQLYSDGPLAGFAAEAAARGRAAVVGCCDWEGVLAGLDPEDVPPSVRCSPEDVGEAIRGLVRDRGRRVEFGARAQRFVSERWARRQVAARYLRLAAGDIPETWLIDPRDIRYCAGCGLTLARVGELVGAVVDLAGPGALGVDDKPALRSRLLELAGR